MNPLDLRGPQFLLFYVVFGITVLVILSLVRRQSESSSATPPTGLLTNYLDIAFLRGGAGEALKVALLALVKRGLLVVDGDKVHARDEGAIRSAQRGTEQGIMEKFAAARAASPVSLDWTLRKTVRDACEPTLIRLGLLPDAETRAARRTLFFWGLLVLGGVAGAKIVVALNRGRSNILFLIVLGIAFLFIAYRVTHPRRTPAGDSMLKDLERLFGDLKGRASSEDAIAVDNNELSLLAAVFGISTLYTAMPDARRLFAPSDSSSSSSSSSGCGSSSSCGSSGCGGGGGCGGCGS